MQVSHILKAKGANVIDIAVTATLAQAVASLAEHRIGALVVRDVVGGLAGILSERDIVRALARDDGAALAREVRDYLTPDVVTCALTDTVEDIMAVMTRGRFRHVPVTDADGKLCGLVSIGDIVKSRIAETEEEAAALRVYISAAA